MKRLLEKIYNWVRKIMNLLNIKFKAILSGSDSTAPYAGLKFIATQDNSSIGYVKYGTPNGSDFSYNLNNTSWVSNWDGTPISLNTGDIVYVKGNNPNGINKYGNSYIGSNHINFTMTGKIEAHGNINSLIDNFDGSRLINNEIPATYTYYKIFLNCTSLTKAPKLPAMILKSDCYDMMFQGCTSLTQAPELPATALASFCYRYMFYGCTSLTQAPKLPATVLEQSCYVYMFYGCTSLTQAPKLPATTMIDSCYYAMFQGCTSLTKAPELPATVLANRCYQSMFSGCTSLTQAPDLPAYSLVSNCYNNMFENCTNLNYIKINYLNNFNTTYFDNWVNGVQTVSGDFYYNGEDRTEGVSAIPQNWIVTSFMDEYTGLKFTAMQNNSKVKYVIDGTPTGSDIQISINGIDWTNWNSDEYKNLSYIGDFIYIRGDNPNGLNNTSGRIKFVMDGEIAASGNVTSLLSGNNSNTVVDVIPNGGCFQSLFNECSSLISAPKLPSTNLKYACYKYMFGNCKKLVTTPELPATSLAIECYEGMFYWCESLKNITGLPATSLADRCYKSMFHLCDALETTPELPALSLPFNCYESMFSACGSLTNVGAILATSVSQQSCKYMFDSCVHLEKAPLIYASTVGTLSFQGMFGYCSSLNYIKLVNYTGDFSTSAFSLWVRSVQTNSGDFYYNGQDGTIASSENDYKGIPSGWTVRTF